MEPTRAGAAGVTAAVLLLGAAGCSNPMYGLRRHQVEDLRRWEVRGQPLVQEKDPALATGLGFLLGFGAFYTEEPALGVIDLLTWPVSILWEPWIAPARANRINYEVTRAAWLRKQEPEPAEPRPDAPP